MRVLHVSAFPVLGAADHVVGVVPEEDLLLKDSSAVSSTTPGSSSAAQSAALSSARTRPAAFGPFREGHWSWPGSLGRSAAW
jgi:hypothetical protein